MAEWYMVQVVLLLVCRWSGDAGEVVIEESEVLYSHLAATQGGEWPYQLRPNNGRIRESTFLWGGWRSN